MLCRQIPLMTDITLQIFCASAHGLLPRRNDVAGCGCLSVAAASVNGTLFTILQSQNVLLAKSGSLRTCSHQQHHFLKMMLRRTMFIFISTCMSSLLTRRDNTTLASCRWYVSELKGSSCGSPSFQPYWLATRSRLGAVCALVHLILRGCCRGHIFGALTYSVVGKSILSYSDFKDRCQWWQCFFAARIIKLDSINGIY